jgi:hypothetical protein
MRWRQWRSLDREEKPIGERREGVGFQRSSLEGHVQQKGGREGVDSSEEGGREEGVESVVAPYRRNTSNSHSAKVSSPSESMRSERLPAGYRSPPPAAPAAPLKRKRKGTQR